MWMAISTPQTAKLTAPGQVRCPARAAPRPAVRRRGAALPGPVGRARCRPHPGSRCSSASPCRGTRSSWRRRRPAAVRSRAGRSISTYAPSWPSTSYWLDTDDGVIVKSRLAWCLGMPQMPLPPFTDTSLLTGRSTTNWPGAVATAKQAGQQRRRRPRTERARDGEGVLDVLADVGDLVVDDGDDQQAAAAGQPHRVQLVAGQQPGGRVAVDGERRHQGGRPLRVDRHGEGDAVDRGAASGQPALPAGHRRRRQRHQLRAGGRRIASRRS